MPRRLLLWGSLAAVSLVLLAAGLEIVGLVWFASQEGGLFYTSVRSEPAPAPRDLRYSVFRPYLGFGVRPGVPILSFLGGAKGARPYQAGAGSVEPRDLASPSERDWTRLLSNNFGFYAPLDYPVREPDSFVVGLFGGSVAHSLAMQGGPRLAARLAGLPALAGRRVRVLNLASGGYKQPQQIVALTYFLLLGQRFDYVVNLDGFNEIVLGSINESRAVDASMPSVVHLAGLELLAGSDVGSLRQRLEVEDLREKREALERERARARLAAHYLLADLRLRWTTPRWLELAAEPSRRERSHPLVALVPPLEGAEGKDAGEKIVAEWQRGSEILAQLASSHGAGYLHVLQPNQYASQHTFSSAEARLALAPNSPYTALARDLYPLLRRQGAQLAREGVDFVDASGLFDAVPQVVYADNCCHYNQRGNDLLADRVFEAMRRHIAPAGDLGDPPPP